MDKRNNPNSNAGKERREKLVLATISVVAIFAIATMEWYARISEKDVLKLVALPAIPVFLGALAAYKIQQIFEWKKLEDLRVESINRNLINLGSITNTICNILAEFNKYEGENRYLELPLMPINDKQGRLSVDSLAFTVGELQEADLLPRLQSLQVDFDNAMFILGQRNGGYKEYLDKISEAGIIQIDGCVNKIDDRHIKIVASAPVRGIKHNTEVLYKMLPEIRNAGVKLAATLATAAKSIYPNRMFYLFKLSEPIRYAP